MDLPHPRDAWNGSAPVVVRPSVPGVPPTPLVLASPHSGRDYGADFVNASRLDLAALRQNEDSLVDELLTDAPALGVPLVAARFPRVFCDANRERWELDPDMFSDPLPPWCNTRTSRVAAGYGTIPRIVGSGERIHRRKLRFEEARLRIETCWEPYHRVLEDLIETTVAREGACLLLDCHSMPAERTGHPADFVLGDNHGTSCAPAVTDRIEAFLAAGGAQVRRNNPYSGGFVTQHYGRPGAGVHVLQLEISRDLYLDETTRERQDGFEALRVRLRDLVEMLVSGGGVLRAIP